MARKHHDDDPLPVNPLDRVLPPSISAGGHIPRVKPARSPAPRARKGRPRRLGGPPCEEGVAVRSQRPVVKRRAPLIRRRYSSIYDGRALLLQRRVVRKALLRVTPR